MGYAIMEIQTNIANLVDVKIYQCARCHLVKDEYTYLLVNGFNIRICWNCSGEIALLGLLSH